jgi:hypothetical protein
MGKLNGRYSTAETGLTGITSWSWRVARPEGQENWVPPFLLLGPGIPADTVRCILDIRLSATLIFERGNIGIVPAQVSIKLPQVAFHRRQPRLDAIEPGIIQKDSNQDQD